MQTILIILLIGILWGTADILRKYATGGTSNQLLSTVFNLATVIGPLIFFTIAIIQKQKIKYEPRGMLIAIIGGLLAGIGGYLIFYLLSKGADISNTIPSIRVLSITLVAVGGIVFFSEQLSLQLILGIVFSVVGIYLLLPH